MLIFAGWVNRHQQDVIEYLQEENRALREQLGGKRLRFSDQQRRRLAAKAKKGWQKGALPNRESSDPGYFVPMVPAADRQKV